MRSLRSFGMLARNVLIASLASLYTIAHSQTLTRLGPPNIPVVNGEVSTGIRETFNRLLARDNALTDFEKSKQSIGVACVDWSAVRMRGPAALFYLDHYWTRFDEDGLESMRSGELQKCSAWRTTNKSDCQCEVIVENGKTVVQVPETVSSRILRSEEAYEVAKGTPFRQALDEIVRLRRSGKFLSEDPSSSYRVVELLQRARCAKDDSWSAGCAFDADKCRERLRSTSSALGISTSQREVEEISCAQISTRFEMPGAYELLARKHVEILAAGKLEKLNFHGQFAFGTLSGNDINAMVGIDGDARVMLFNTKLFSFIYEMSKVAAMTLPFQHEVEGSISLNSEEDALNKYLDKNPMIEALFRDTVLTFIGKATRPPLIPDTNIRPVLLAITDGAELFAMAHEMGHSALGHEYASKLSLDHSGCWKGNDEGARWLEEIEADYVGSQLLKRVRDIKAACSGGVIYRHGLSLLGKPLEHCEAHPFSLAVPFGQEMYFLARQISRDACGAGQSDQPTNEELGVVAFARSCSESRACEFLRDIKKSLPIALLEKKGHPHPAVRRELARIWYSDEDLVGYENPVAAIGNGLTRNSRLIWNRSLPSIVVTSKEMGQSRPPSQDRE